MILGSVLIKALTTYNNNL